MFDMNIMKEEQEQEYLFIFYLFFFFIFFDGQMYNEPLICIALNIIFNKPLAKNLQYTVL